MKPQLPCCETNKISNLNTVDCIYCGFCFRNQELADQHVHDLHKEKVEVKRKLSCCWKIRSKHHPYGKLFSCPHCECKLTSESSRKDHMRSTVHECPKCHELLTTDYQRDLHRIRHAEEDKIRKQQQQKERLDEYQQPSDHHPDIEYILTKHDIGNEELLVLIKRFDIEFFEELGCVEVTERFTVDEIIYLRIQSV